MLQHRISHFWLALKTFFGFAEAETEHNAPANPSHRETSTHTHDELIARFGDSIAPVNVGGLFGEVVGQITSTMLDGPGVALDSGNTFSGLIEIRAASLVGDSHVESGTRRQDAYAVHIDRDVGSIHIAVCDGVGSRSRSNEGAALVATTVAREAAIRSPNPVGAARLRLTRMAEAAGVPAIEYSTTLIWVDVDVGQPGDVWEARLLQYGDGDVRLLSQTEALWRSVSRSTHVDEADALSFSLPLGSHPRREHVFSWHPGEALVVATDGLAYHLDSQTKVGYYLANSWCRPPGRWDFLSDVAFRTLGAGDDRTAVALWRTDVRTMTEQHAQVFANKKRRT